MTFGEKLKNLIKEKDLSLEKIAQEINGHYQKKINKSMLSKWQNDKEEPKMEYVVLLAKYFQVTLDYLMGICHDEKNIEQAHKLLNFEFDLAEQVIIKKYRVLDEHGKKAVDSILDIEFDRVEEFEKKR